MSGHAPALSAVKTWVQAIEAARDAAGWSPDVARKVLAHLTEDILAEPVEEALEKSRPPSWAPWSTRRRTALRHFVPSPQVVEPLRRYPTRLDSAEKVALWNA
ncbi:hypothetical protein [Streptomyces sp. NPDC046859]|uniref:hypothetical protein n=1 Tax=Streptomyces sp. NPDC046859 TaxID=3155734 RepID=UPI0034084190